MEAKCGPHLDGFEEDAGGFFEGEVADGVEDPVEGEAELALGRGGGRVPTPSKMGSKQAGSWLRQR